MEAPFPPLLGQVLAGAPLSSTLGTCPLSALHSHSVTKPKFYGTSATQTDASLTPLMPFIFK